MHSTIILGFFSRNLLCHIFILIGMNNWWLLGRDEERKLYHVLLVDPLIVLQH